jgi:hypothetical protein
LKSKEYLNFVVSKIEKDLKISGTTAEQMKCVYVLGMLKNSENLLKDIYTISRIKNFKPLGNYLLFILKKSETGEVRFDNLIENLNQDREFIMRELKSRFRLDARDEDGSPKEITRKPKDEEVKEEKITNEIKKILAESKFKVEEIDNELVTEEFIETDIKQDNDSIVRGNYLELIQPDGAFEEDSVFSLPMEKQKDEEFPEEDVFALPGEKPEEREVEKPEISADGINTEELEEVSLDASEVKGVIEVEEVIGVEKDEKAEIENKVEEGIIEELIPEGEFEKEELSHEDIIFEEATEEKIEEIKKELSEEQEVIEVEEVKEEERIEEKAEIEEIKAEITETKEEEETEFAEAENSVYMRYETELMQRNAILYDKFDELKSLDREEKGFEEKKDGILKEITEHSAYLEEYSRRMSFEVITSVYNVMNMTFVSYGRTVGGEILGLFKNSMVLVESLIKGEDFAGFDSIIKSLDALKHTLLESKKEETKTEENEETELPQVQESQEGEKLQDSSQRQKLAQLKQNIIEIENVFKSLEEIKGKYQSYEALRRLSHTFAHLKEMVNIANAIEMRKVAQLAEASYIFIKFVQNYRMDPFESEISEVFKYIIYNFKLIFLDKPTKDIDLLISYLNDPVKIFEKKEKK